MNRKRTRTNSSEAGQALIMVALSLVALLAVLALALDGGNLYLQRRRMQNAADAGALAGARELALAHSEAAAQAMAEEYAIYRNEADRADVSFEDEGTTIWVVAHKDVPMSFARILGIEEITVSGRAAAATFGGIETTRGTLAPICLYEPSDETWYVPCCEEGQDPGDPLDPECIDEEVDPLGCTWTFWDDTKEDENEELDHELSGDLRGWADPGCAGCNPPTVYCPDCDPPTVECAYPPKCGDVGADLLAEWMMTGYPGEVSIQTWLRGDNGVKNHPVAITQARVGQVLLIAIYDDADHLYPNMPYFHVKRLVAFEVTEVHSTGNPKGLTGRIVNHTFPGTIGGNSDGARTFRLIN